VGGGSFGFIPDYSMVGTVFVNWCATVLATASQNLTIDLGTVILHTGLIQYGQSRDFVMPMSQKPDDAEEGVIDEFAIARYELLAALRICIGTDRANAGRNQFTALYEKYRLSTNPKVKELIKDIKPPGEDDEGQVHMAPKYWFTWGKHYLRAYLKAQETQTCMNFRDPGLQIYGGPMFHEHQETGNTFFCDLPPLEPTGQSYISPAAAATIAAAGPVSMASTFLNAGSGCFAPHCQVLMADGKKKAIDSIKKGDLVWTSDGPASVLLHVTLGSYNNIRQMCRIGNLLITPWHPVHDSSRWIFPEDIVPSEECTMPTVYNLVLSHGNIINVEDILSVTLGHEYTEDVLKHEFFGSRKRILEALSKQPGFEEGYPVYKNLITIRDTETGKVIDWTDGV
jgi:hypothetical protein